ELGRKVIAGQVQAAAISFVVAVRSGKRNGGGVVRIGDVAADHRILNERRGGGHCFAGGLDAHAAAVAGITGSDAGDVVRDDAVEHLEFAAVAEDHVHPAAVEGGLVLIGDSRPPEG